MCRVHGITSPLPLLSSVWWLHDSCILGSLNCTRRGVWGPISAFTLGRYSQGKRAATTTLYHCSKYIRKVVSVLRHRLGVHQCKQECYLREQSLSRSSKWHVIFSAVKGGNQIFFRPQKMPGQSNHEILMLRILALFGCAVLVFGKFFSCYFISLKSCVAVCLAGLTMSLFLFPKSCGREC